jgi:hypothetical protein
MSAHAVEALNFKVSPALDHAISRIAELARECGDKTREIIKLRHQLAHYKNQDIKAASGLRLCDSYHGKAPITLEYEFDPAQKADETTPACDASASLIRVWIGGEPFSYEVFCTSLVEGWESECLAREGA